MTMRSTVVNTVSDVRWENINFYGNRNMVDARDISRRNTDADRTLYLSMEDNERNRLACGHRYLTGTTSAVKTDRQR